MYDPDREKAIEGMWAAYKKARAKHLPDRLIVKKKRRDIDSYMSDSVYRAKYGKFKY